MGLTDSKKKILGNVVDLMEPKILLIEACDFESFPKGGQLSFARQLLQVFGERFALVGVCADDGPIGRWVERRILGRSFLFFGLAKEDPSIQRPFIPRRLSSYFRLRRYKSQILSLGADCAFVQAPEVMIAVSDWNFSRLCYRFAGTDNPLAMPRYWWGKALATQFDKSLFRALQDKAELILASADNEAIDTLVHRSNGALDRKRIIQFPTRIDTRIFKIDPAQLASNPRAATHPTFVTCGRINRVKGWELIIDAFSLVQKKLPAAKLYFVGDGEDTALLRSRAAKAGILNATTITGFKSPKEVAGFLNRADVFVLGSHREGWPNALLEALACGLPIVATDVSSVKEIIVPGLNGYIVAKRDPVEYADKMLAAVQLQCPNMYSLRLARRYSIDTLEHDLASLWEPLRRYSVLRKAV